MEFKAKLWYLGTSKKINSEKNLRGFQNLEGFAKSGLLFFGKSLNKA
ncbi:hypothetical protein BGP_4103 [Beggiatoa sp. PS]|nr:hypothetical protein BGP_4103 [Beggiatoa sp. PS]